MAFVIATLIARSTADGLAEMADHVELGRTYVVDTSTLRKSELYNLELKRHHSKWLIDSDDGSYLFADLLSWPGKDLFGN